MPYFIASYTELFVTEAAREWKFLGMHSYVISHVKKERCFVAAQLAMNFLVYPVSLAIEEFNYSV
jgi:hypothetical protein